MIGVDEMDEELGGLPSTTGDDTSDDTTGGLSVYSDPSVQKAMTKFEELARQQQARYDAQAKAIAEKRYGPSFSERMFQLSAALATPTAQRGIGGILANVTPVLQAQMQAKREGELSRREALEKLDADRLAQQVGLAKQGVTTSLAMAKIKAAANKPVDPFKGAVYDPNTMRWVPRPGTAGAPPVLTPEQAAEFAKDPKNRGMKFYTTDGRPMEIK